MEKIFKASVKYGDYVGSAAADIHDHRSIHRYLIDKELLKENTDILGVKMFSGEVHDDIQDKPVYVSVYWIYSEEHESLINDKGSENPIKVRLTRFEMHLNEFFGLYKRFEICVSKNGMLNERNLQILE